jgi:hypothetical protein
MAGLPTSVGTGMCGRAGPYRWLYMTKNQRQPPGDLFGVNDSLRMADVPVSPVGRSVAICPVPVVPRELRRSCHPVGQPDALGDARVRAPEPGCADESGRLGPGELVTPTLPGVSSLRSH